MTCKGQGGCVDKMLLYLLLFFPRYVRAQSFPREFILDCHHGLAARFLLHGSCNYFCMGSLYSDHQSVLFIAIAADGLHLYVHKNIALSVLQHHHCISYPYGHHLRSSVCRYQYTLLFVWYCFASREILLTLFSIPKDIIAPYFHHAAWQSQPITYRQSRSSLHLYPNHLPSKVFVASIGD